MAVAGFAPRTLELKDGTKVHVRPIEPSDEPLLHEAVAAMSERTVYFRFFTPLKRMPDALAHRLAVVDYHDRFAILAKVAREQGIKTFSLIVLPENQQMLGVLRKMGWIHQARLAGGVYEISFDLPAEVDS